MVFSDKLKCYFNELSPGLSNLRFVIRQYGNNLVLNGASLLFLWSIFVIVSLCTWAMGLRIPDCVYSFVYSTTI